MTPPTQTVPAAAAALPKPRTATATPEAAKSARSGLAMSAATFTMAAASAIQAVLYLSAYGTSGRTDGFFVAFALYTTIGVFSQSIRLTSVPLLVGPRARLTLREYGITLGLMGLPLLIATVPLAGPLAGLLAPGLSDADRAVTESALPILGVATVLQLWAAGAATVLAIGDRFNTVAGGYIAGAVAGLAAYVGLSGAAGELTLGWSMLTMAVVTCGWMLIGLRDASSRAAAAGAELAELAPRRYRLLPTIATIFGPTAIYLAFNLLFVITLSFASSSAAGDATVLSYAYLFASYLVAGTGMALGMSRIPDMTRTAAVDRQAVIADHVPPGFRYSMMAVAPALAGLITAGAPLIHELFPGSLDAAGVENLRIFAALLAAWTLAALLVNFLLPGLFALGRARLVNALALPLVALHVAATYIGSELFGVEGAVGAMFVAPTCFAAVLLAVSTDGGGGWRLLRGLAGDTLRFVALAAIAFGIGEFVGTTLADGLAAALLTVVVGCGLYGAGIALAARRQVSSLLGALRPASA